MIRVWRGLKDGVGVGFHSTRCCVGTGFRDKGGVYGNRPDRINKKKLCILGGGKYGSVFFWCQMWDVTLKWTTVSTIRRGLDRFYEYGI